MPITKVSTPQLRIVKGKRKAACSVKKHDPQIPPQILEPFDWDKPMDRIFLNVDPNKYLHFNGVVITPGTIKEIQAFLLSCEDPMGTYDKITDALDGMESYSDKNVNGETFTSLHLTIKENAKTVNAFMRAVRFMSELLFNEEFTRSDDNRYAPGNLPDPDNNPGKNYYVKLNEFGSSEDCNFIPEVTDFNSKIKEAI